MTNKRPNADVACEYFLDDTKELDYCTAGTNGPWYTWNNKGGEAPNFLSLGLEWRIRPLPWQEQRDAFKAGKMIQYQYAGRNDWHDCLVAPSWSEHVKFRIKPKVLPYRLALLKLTSGNLCVVSVNNQYEAKEAERRGSFVKWDGDWKDVEV